jgi:hypothetical protein|tara:strand:+ start:109 stop:480 length:372 start_codon:yes stop_codon:yes gene_type:complete
MKKVYSAVLIANLLIESAGAFALFAAPEFLVDAGNASAVLWSWNYGFVALAVGSAVFWTWPHRDSFPAAGAVLGILFSFHLAIAVALAIAGELFVDVILHGAFAVLCLYLFTHRLKWCLAPTT